MKEELKFHLEYAFKDQRQFEDQKQVTVYKFVDYCREVQRNFIEGDGLNNSSINGESVLLHGVNEGILTMQQAMYIRPAIVNYNTPYQISFT